MRCSPYAVAGAFLLYFTSATAFAQSVTPEEDLRAYVGMKGTIPLPEAGAFGEQINPLTGELKLVQTDAWLNTNSFPLSVTRSFTPGGSRVGMPRTGAFADWQLELPRITTLTVRGSDGHGWQVSGSNPNARCSAFAPPPAMAANQLLSQGSHLSGNEGTAFNADAIDPNVWWQGYQLIVPGQGEQEVLHRDPDNTLAPNGSPANYPMVTKQQWQIGCLSQTDNGEPGEAFVALAPDGTQYTFNRLVYTQASALSLADIGTITRWRASMLVTKIEDRFGNVQQFVYDGDRLVTVINPNEMQLDIKYRTDVPTLVDQVILRPYTANPRRWTYQYANLGTGRETLANVIQPDGTAWGYKLQGLADAALSYSGTTTCNALAPFNASQTFTGTLTDPNGLTESLTLSGVRHGRAQVVNDCSISAKFPWDPSQFDTLSLTQQRYTGANLPYMVWTYRYADIQASPAWVELAGTNGKTRFTYSNTADESEGRLVTLDINRQGDGSTSRTYRFDYASANAGPYPTSLGAATSSRVNASALGGITPMVKKTLLQDGDSYFTEWRAFNAFAQPTQVRRSNSIAGQPSLETRIDYLNDLPHWVLGLPQSVTNMADNSVIGQNVYDLAQVTLKERYRFGLRQASYAYTSQGLLASQTDGNGLATQYQNYVMGKPVTTVHPDGTSEANWPDDFGNITTHTDRAGVTTTAQYDIMGRLVRAGGPQGDSVAWNDTTYSYTYVTTPEYGFAEGHWRRQVSRGASTVMTYYDALMRPLLTASRYDDSHWISQRYDFDNRGRPTFSSYPQSGWLALNQLNKGMRVVYDALDRPLGGYQDSELPQGTLATNLRYYPGACVEALEAKIGGGITTTCYQVLDAPSTDRPLSVKSSGGITQTIARDAYGLPLSLTQSGVYQKAQISLTRQYIYDSNKRLCRTIEPETGSTVVDYDAGSRVTWSAQGIAISGNDCGREQVTDTAKTRRTYDAMDRILSMAYPTGTLSSQFTYDAMGRITSADTGLSRWTYVYNLLGLPASETLVVDGLPYTLGYTYDANASLASTTYPDGRVVDHAPDAWGRPTQAGSFANAARYLPNGELEYFKYGNGVEYVTEQNARQLPRNLSYSLPDGNLLFSQDFNYDANGNLTQANDLLQGVGSQRQFSYDELNRLTRATLPGAANAETYSYDPLNNLRQITADNGLQRDYQYDPLNRLSNAVGSDGQRHQFTYDNRGNTIQRDSTPLTFDLANRLTEVNGRESYVYDAFGRRVLKTRLNVGGNKTYYVYSNQTGQLMLERDNDVASSETDYIYLGNKLVAQATTRKQDLPGAITFTPGSPTDGIYTIAWGAAGNAAAYELEEQHDGVEWISIYRGNTTSYTIPGWAWERPGGTYLYRLRACGTTCGDWVISSPMGVMPQTIDWHTFSPFQGIQKGGYRLSWAAPYGATNYDVDEGKLNVSGSQMEWTRIATEQADTFIDRPGGRYGTYTYRVTARNAYGGREPAYTGEIAEDPTETGPPIAPQITQPVSGHISSKNFPYPLNVTWTLVGRATHYEVALMGPYKCTSSSNTCVIGVPPNDYTITVRACNDYGCSEPSKGVYVVISRDGIPMGAAGDDASVNAKERLPAKEGQP